jgi:hypothetical protein
MAEFTDDDVTRLTEMLSPSLARKPKVQEAES